MTQTVTLTQPDIRAKFRRTYNGAKNFLTPDILRYGQQGDKLYELSCGQGIGGDALFGVTVISTRGDKLHEFSSFFPARVQAEAYIKTLRGRG